MGFYVARRAISPTSSDYKKGLHRGHASGLAGVDADLIAANIKYNIVLFGITGTMVIWQAQQNKALTLALPSVSLATIEDHSGGNSPVVPTALSLDLPTIGVATAQPYSILSDCESAWSEYVQAGVTVTADADCKVGTKSNKLVITDGVSVGRLATTSFGAMDLSSFKYIKFWIKSSVTINTNELSILLDDHAGCVSPAKDLNVGALVANTWTEKLLALGDASGLTAVISLGLDMDVDKGAFDLFIDQVRVTEGGT
ncbi:MAG: hypothetical protein A9183_00735 [Dehalococcoides mccartyi]|uniref:hypothetical protein n=1 Tax=Dehalococcoides mccartyi TaxID=61435 RepID=UPI0008058196|nr:hypothetical protein [Dehalococcoides mccartyi]OBW62935.1 MAG: hypothetical protein A9183_00735 [Dehalococcoides mccartyi]